MTLKRLFILLLSLSFVVSPAAKAQTVERPTWVWSSAGIKYWFVKNLVLDVDEMLNEKGLQSKACIYRSAITKIDTPYAELGPCLYKHFMESMDTNQNSGVTYLWLVGTEADSMPIEIHWRPPHEGLKKFLKQALEMKLEGPLYWLRSHLGKIKTAEDVRYTEFIGGEIKMILPDDKSFLSALDGKGNPWVSHYLKNIHQIELAMKPSGRSDGLVVHSGTILADLKKSNSENETKAFSVQTNLNVLVKSRKFYIKVKTEGSEDLGPFPEASHAP